jgi:Fe-S-cluster containining protein
MGGADQGALARLRALYQEVDQATRDWVTRHPPGGCDPGCADCCHREPPLVSREEAALVREAVAALPPDVARGVLERSARLSREVAAAPEAAFTCPLLVPVHGVGRCACYLARPYACRTFGQTSRPAPGGPGTRPFSCPRILPRLGGLSPPLFPFRSRALRDRVKVLVVVDSYLPVWLAHGDDELEERSSGPGSAVVVPCG